MKFNIFELAELQFQLKQNKFHFFGQNLPKKISPA